MTIEELDIIVNAKIEPALKEIKKLMPQIKQQVTQAVTVAQKSMDKVDANKISNKIQQALQSVKKRVDSFKKKNSESEVKIKVNNKEASKQITQLEKEIDSLQKKITASKLKLDVVSPKLDAIYNDTAKSVTPDGLDSDNLAIQKTINSSLAGNKEYQSLYNQESKLIENMRIYNEQLAQAKSKVAQLKSSIQDSSSSQNKLTSFFSAFKDKVTQTTKNVSGLRNAFSRMPKITQQVTNNITNMGSSLKGGLKHVLKYAGALFSLRGIYSVLSSSAQSWLSSQNEGAQQLNANIEYLRYSMGSVFAPIIQTVINLVYKLMQAIQSVVYAISGVNIFAKATASSMGKTANSASKASKSLAGVHGEINNVSENNGGGGSGATSPTMDLTQMDTSMNNFVEKIKSKLLVLFEPIKKSWETYGQPLIDGIKNAFNGIKSLVTSIGNSFGEVWLNGTGQKTIDLLLQGLTSVFNIIGNIGQAFSDAWNNGNLGTAIVQGLWNTFNNLYSIVIGIYQTFEEWTASESFQAFATAILEICQTLSGWFEVISVKLKEIWENGGKQTFTKLLEFISKLTEGISVVIKVLTPVVEFVLNIVTPVIQGIIKVIGHIIDMLSAVLDFIIGVFTGDWERAWNGIKNYFESYWNAIKEIVQTVINFVKTYISEALKMIETVWTTIWTVISTFFKTIWEGIKTIVSNVINTIKTTISTVLNTIKTVWNNVWEGIKTVVSNVWNGIWNTIKNIVNKILGGIESFVNGTIKGINKLLSGISKVANAVGSVLGLNPINLQLSTISLPRLAKGNVAYSPMIAQFGEYAGARTNPEITAPQNIMRDTFSDVLSDYEWNNTRDTGEFKQLVIQFGSTKVALEIESLLQQARRQNGTAYATI